MGGSQTALSSSKKMDRVKDQMQRWVAMSMQKGRGYRLMVDFRAASAWVDLVPCPVPELKVNVVSVLRVPSLCSLDLLRGYW